MFTPVRNGTKTPGSAAVRTRASRFRRRRVALACSPKLDDTAGRWSTRTGLACQVEALSQERFIIGSARAEGVESKWIQNT